ncbi:zinc finger CCCH domain-containing protein 3 [Melitaea cinxia]|uniref:zinc finger CCCH domain-containing protein 3 n=1 Tax=Melitaea cinxia TaxID=113334 RepID=UPI001E27016D|nr:zinc finger CCCH domain-containing protein 3 [Melitaea cinxia]
MDGNLNKKVYLNPNFKGPLINNSWPFIHPNVQNLYQCFPQQMQNDMLFVENNSNRRIYVNPNFKQVKHENRANSTFQETNIKAESMKSSPKLISTSKYSLVANVTKNVISQRNNYREDRQYNSMYTTQKTDISNQSINTQKVLHDKYQNGVPIVKSRYTIVRKNKDLSNIKAENKLENLKEKISSSLNETPNKSLSVGTCNNNVNHSIKNHEYVRSENKPSEKITKIKISKYKTVPITYLKKNLSVIKAKELKSNPTVLQTKNTAKFNKLEFSLNNNRYKLIRPSSKPLTHLNSPKAFIQALNKNDPSKIKLLRANFKVNNIPCRLFTKYGKCLRKDYGKCEFLHDKKHVSLCRKFLKGICHDSNCTLSHELTANKMPTCFFYLKGVCTKENCPYVHVKLSEKIKMCPNFLRGYCEKGDTCKLRHVKVNQPKLLSINSRNKIQNKIIKLKKGKPKGSIQSKRLTLCSDSTNINTQNDDQSNVECRYYKESSFSSSNEISNIKPTRCKIGTLPSFIEL